MLKGSSALIIPRIKIIRVIMITTIPKDFPNFCNFICNGVDSSFSWTIPAIFPISVDIPVETTIPFPLP